MTYTVDNFKTKKALKEAVAQGKIVRTFEPGGIATATLNGTVFLEGPHYPAPHSWYAKAEVREGRIVRVS